MGNRKKWNAFTLYLVEHPGAFDKQERAGIEWAREVIRMADKVDKLRPPRSLNPDVTFAIALDNLRAALKSAGEKEGE